MAERSHTVHAFDALGLPRLHGIQRVHEHFVQAKRIRAVFLNDIVRVHHVLQGLAHLGHDLRELDVGSLLEEVAQAPSASARPCRCASTPSRHSPFAAVPFFSSSSSERFAFGRSPHFVRIGLYFMGRPVHSIPAQPHKTAPQSRPKGSLSLKRKLLRHYFRFCSTSL